MKLEEEVEFAGCWTGWPELSHSALPGVFLQDSDLRPAPIRAEITAVFGCIFLIIAIHNPLFRELIQIKALFPKGNIKKKI